MFVATCVAGEPHHYLLGALILGREKPTTVKIDLLGLEKLQTVRENRLAIR